ncbi:acyl-CoA dehydrogenase domain-containing protein [Mycobacterium bohemicum DSM 44277]|uniref:Acyl-CoA dehydrogenase domain-containing protein n=1 Tax=Mycobacterium bohemicum DSM 44277 TaxID=1236609 RepID=A0A0U0W470_MYCBE|nr:acyl-CoA dehydrogenase family protein [Mycobacterium bohemicum]CPR06888.1 acyl-CoA dehydrogenase domain-containing protein [Mycobacterium bohemicum DSM 44277]
MKATLTAERREFASSLRALLKAECPVTLVRALNEPGADRSAPTLWKALAGAGVFGLAIAEEFGGSGGSLDDLAVFSVEAGRALFAAQPALRGVANAAVALGSLDLVGVGQAVIDRTVGYTMVRHQFGRPIASFQAAQHLIANMHIALAAARLAAHSAVFWMARGRVATRETAIARMHAATAARLVTLDAHQLHGGMGYVTETDLHLWSERARWGSTLAGGADVAAAWLEETMNEQERA